MSGPICVLGLDGGGTHTRAMASTLAGMVVGEGQGGPCNIAAMSPEDALVSVQEASDAALAQAGLKSEHVRAVCAGVAGASYETRRASLHAALCARHPNAQVAVVPDFAVALAGATGGRPGMIVIAGTGSVAYGEAAKGRAHRTGGFAYLIDDAGSGYGVGRAAIGAVLRAADGTGEPTALAGRVLASLHLSSILELVPGVSGGGIGRVAIASLSRAVSSAALEDNDRAAQAILMRAGGALAHLAHGVASALFSDQSVSFAAVKIGGLWHAGAPLTDVFTRSLMRFAPHAHLTQAQQPPVYGAVLRALTLLPIS